MFSRPDGPLPDPCYLSKVFQRIIKITGLKRICLHDLRHTYATLQRKANQPIETISKVLGHANIGITLDIYSQVLPGIQEAAAGKFDRIFEAGNNENSGPDVSKIPCRKDTKAVY